MHTKIITGALIATAIIALAIATTAFAFLGNSTSLKAQTEPEVKKVLTDRQTIWLNALAWCESSGNPEAINPKDSDGKPSYGLLQFRPSTLEYFAEKYGIATSSKGVMDAETQKAIVAQMIAHGVDLHHQFPGCTRAIGYPPKA